jgi:oligoribonuclease NrnB/cAMP/cGMP phosphodiesterase (DHH superfamily)
MLLLVGNTIVISHRKDADGISSAALVRYMTGAEVYLTDYGDMVETLSSVGKAHEYYICDLGTNQNTFPGFLEQLRRLSRNGRVFYTDHHPISEENASKIRELSVDLNHSTEECASVLLFKKYEEDFKDSPQMKIITCCAAITDYMDSRPYAKKLISSFDRQFLLYEATVLSFTIAMIGRGSTQSNAKLAKLAKELAKERLPHEIKRASIFAQTHARKSAALVKLAKKNGLKMKNFAYMFTKESSTGNVANFLIGAFDVPVGVALREEEPGYYEISLRSSDESNKDLGKIISKISVELGASGGGHPHASGARIKKSQFEEFASLLDDALSAY